MSSECDKTPSTVVDNAMNQRPKAPRLSKTRMRQMALHPGPAVPLSDPPKRLVSLPHERRSRIYKDLIEMATPVNHQSNWVGHLFELPAWIQPFEQAGIRFGLLKALGVCWLPEANQAADLLRQRYSLQSLIASGLFDPDGEFRFARHRVLLPFSSESEPDYLLGLDPEAGFTEILSPTLDWPSAYRIEAGERSLQPNRLYLTTELETALRLGALDLNAWAVQSAGHLTPACIEEMKAREVVVCLGRQSLSSNYLEPFRKQLEPVCRRFFWQSLAQAETQWLLIKSRQERAQLVVEELEPHHPWISRLADAFQKRKSRWLKLISK